jgi:hypothetical protein
MVHHDTDLYDLLIRAGTKSVVIHTTRNHPFWDATAHRWVKAGALRYGTHLRTRAGGYATVTEGWTPPRSTGSMWDLTIPGDHDFYIDTIAAAILVHNCTAAAGLSRDAKGRFGSTMTLMAWVGNLSKLKSAKFEA